MHPILLKLGPITIYSYGTFVAFAFLAAAFFITKGSPKHDIPKEKIWDLLLTILISGMIGARLLHILLNLRIYRMRPLDILMFHRGGLAIHGAIVAAILGAIIFLRRNKLSFWRTGDLIMLYLPLGQAIGRIGCLLNGCCYGTNGHPTQIYSSILLLITFIMLKIISGKERGFDGRVFIAYFLIFTPFRFFIDFLRADLQYGFFGLTVSQNINMLLFASAAILYYFRKKA